ncbi:metallopeptidase [Candidatus Microgenomates bacterium]|nr:metallopeptidase [Candidatus Microgenomates bacterium]
MKRSKKARKSTKSRGQVSWKLAPDIKKRSHELISQFGLDWIRFERIFFYRSIDSKAKAYARTWGLPRLWQRSLKVEPSYMIEVLAEHFDKLDEMEQDKIILHELSHIPKTFSGALLPHTRHTKGSFHDKLDILLKDYHKQKGKKRFSMFKINL